MALTIASVIGLYISLYFTLVLYKVITPRAPVVPGFCRLDESTCHRVVHHPDARVFGIPNSVMGIVYYVLVLFFSLSTSAQVIGPTLMYASWVTVALAIYLTYSLTLKLSVLCPLCLVCHGTNILVAVVLTLNNW